jgi:hypothetical protein
MDIPEFVFSLSGLRFVFNNIQQNREISDTIRIRKEKVFNKIKLNLLLLLNTSDFKL